MLAELYLNINKKILEKNYFIVIGLFTGLNLMLLKLWLLFMVLDFYLKSKILSQGTQPFLSVSEELSRQQPPQ